MNVVPLRDYVSRETVAVLQHLLDRANRGEIMALAVCAKDSRNREEIAFTGDYRSDPGHALNAAMRMSWRLTQLQDDAET